MITSITHAPHTYTPVWAPVVWTALSDAVASTGFLYVFDVYSVGATSDTRIARVKQPASPSGYASLDISTIVQPYLQPALALLEADRAIGSTAQFLESADLMQGVYLKIGEEISGTVYSGLTGATQAGEPGYTALSRDGYYVRTFAGAENIIDARNNDVYGLGSTGTSASVYGVYSVYVPDVNNPGLFITGVTSNEVRLQDRHTLAFFNRNLLGTDDVAAIEVYDGTSFTLLYNLTTNGGGPRGATGATALWTLPYQEWGEVAVGPADLGLTASYYVQGVNADNDLVLNRVYFNLYEDCPGCYPSIRFSWLNPQGGRDYYNFNMYYEINYGARNDTYYKDPNQWSASAWSLKPWQSGNTVYNKELSRSIKVTSDWLTFSQIGYLKKMFESPNVLVYLPNETIPQTCTIKDTTYAEKLVIAQRMYNLEFTVDLSFGDKVQNT